MPKRTNGFQQLVLLLQNQLAGPNVTVTESKLLIDMETKTPTEVDVCVEMTVQGGIPVCLGFECTAGARTRRWNGCARWRGCTARCLLRKRFSCRVGFHA